MKTKKFTLIELIVVISVLGVLAAIVIPNIGNFKEKSLQTALNKDIQNLQTVADMYSLDHNGLLPTIQQPKPDMSESINFTSLYPDYERNLPRSNAYYWIDINGTVWASLTDAPQGVLKTEQGKLDWNQVSDATSYQVFEVVSQSKTSAAADAKVKYVTYGEPTTETEMVVEAGKTYSVSAIDRNGNLSAPIGTTRYTGYIDTLAAAVKGEKQEFNRKPVAHFKVTPNEGIDTITPLIWDTKNSFDPDYDQLVKEEWKINGVVSSTPPTLLTTVGANQIELRVQDSKGEWSDVYSQTIDVAKGNSKPVAKFTVSPIQNIDTMTTLTWNTAASYDPDNDAIVQKEWKVNGTIVANPPSLITVVGNHTIELRVQDDKGKWSDTYSQIINVRKTNQPTASISINPTTIYPTTSVTFNYTNFNDLDGDTFGGVEWMLDGVAKSNPNGTISKTGSHTIQMRVKDSRGLWGEWVSKTFTVNPTPSTTGTKTCTFGNYSDTCHYVLDKVKNSPITLNFKATTYNNTIYSDQGGYLVIRGDKSGVIASQSITSFTGTYTLSVTPQDNDRITIDVSPRSSGTSVELTFSYSYYTM